jgi:hypothetical protein
MVRERLKDMPLSNHKRRYLALRYLFMYVHGLELPEITFACGPPWIVMKNSVDIPVMG